MIRKATKAAFALSAMLDNTTSATLINKLFSQLIEPILLYGVEKWLPYAHPRKIDQVRANRNILNPKYTIPYRNRMERNDIFPLFPPKSTSILGV